MQLFFGMLIGAAICLLAVKRKFSKDYGRLKTCRNDCQYYRTAVDTVKSQLVLDEVLRVVTNDDFNGEEDSNE